MTTLTIAEARQELLGLPEKLARVPERAITITRRGRPVLAVLPWEFYESLLETLDISADPEMAAARRESLDDMKHGRLVSHDEATKRLGGGPPAGRSTPSNRIRRTEDRRQTRRGDLRSTDQASDQSTR